MDLIYTYMGNEIRHGLTMAFIDHDMSMKWLREHIPTERTSCTTLEDAEDALDITASSTKNDQQAPAERLVLNFYSL